MNITDLAKQYSEMRGFIDELNDKLKKLKADCETLENTILEAMVEEGVRSLNVEGVGTLSMAASTFFNVNAANKPLFLSYLKEAGHGHIIKEDVNSQTLKAFLREHAEELMRTYVERGFDEVEARNQSQEFLKEKGAQSFTERSVRLKRG